MSIAKKIIILIAVALVFAAVLKISASDKPAYPIKLDEVVLNTEALDPLYSVHEEEALNDKQTVFIVTDDNENEVFGISSAEVDGKQLLNVGFMPFHSENAVKLEDCEQVMMFVSKLSGLFKADESLYDAFIKECGVKNTEFKEYEINVRSKLPERKRDITWEGNLDGIYCAVRLSEPVDSDTWFLSSVTVTTDKSFVYTDNE